MSSFSNPELNKENDEELNNETDTNNSIFVKSQIFRNILLSIDEIGNNLKTVLENKIRHNFEGKCCAEGIIKQNSCNVLTYSVGNIDRNGYINIGVIFECLLCNPVRSMIVPCKIQNITKAGLNAKSSNDDPSPIKVFIAREYGITEFDNYKIDDEIMVKVIGQRYQLQDPVMSLP